MRLSENKTKELKNIFKYLNSLKVYVENDDVEEFNTFLLIKRNLMMSICDMLNFDAKLSGNYPYDSQYIYEENTRETDYKNFFTEEQKGE